MVELYGGLTVLSRILVVSLELAVPLIFFFALVGRRKNGTLRLRILDYLEDFELDRDIQNISIAVLGLVIYFTAYELVISLLELLTVPYLGLMLVGLSRNMNIAILAVSTPVIVGILYYYLYDNQALKQKIDLFRNRLDTMEFPEIR